MSLVLGIDNSTTATKAILVDEPGEVKGTASAEYGYETPPTTLVGAETRVLVEGTIASIRDVMEATGNSPRDIEAVGLNRADARLGPPRRRRRVVRPAILWNDQRTGPQCDEIRRRVGKQKLIEITGNDALTGFTAPKLLWVQDHEPENWARVRHVLLPQRLCAIPPERGLRDRCGGRIGTVLFDLKSRTWSPEVSDALGVAPDLLPTTHEGPDVTGKVSHDGAAATRSWLAPPLWPEGRPIGQRRRCRGDRTRCRRSVPRHFRSRVRHDRRPGGGTRRSGPLLLSCCPRTVAHDGGDAVGGRQPEMAEGCGCPRTLLRRPGERSIPGSSRQ